MGANFMAGVTEISSVTREAGRTIGNGADGISDIEGKVARVATSKLGNERVSISRCHRQARWTGQPPRADALACKTNGRDPRGQTRGVESRKAVASSRPQTVKAQVTKSDPS